MRQHTDGKSYPDSMFLNAEAVYKEQAEHFKALSKYYEKELKHLMYMAARDDSCSNTLLHLVKQAIFKHGFDRKLSFAACAEPPTYSGDRHQPFTVEYQDTKYTYLLAEGDTLSINDGHLAFNLARGKCHIGQHDQEVVLLDSSAECTRSSFLLAPDEYLIVRNGELVAVSDANRNPCPHVPRKLDYGFDFEAAHAKHARQLELDLASTRAFTNGLGQGAIPDTNGLGGDGDCNHREAFLQDFDREMRKYLKACPPVYLGPGKVFASAIGKPDQCLQLRDGKLVYEDAPPLVMDDPLNECGYDERTSALGPDASVPDEGTECCGTEEAPEDAPTITISVTGDEYKDMMDPKNWGLF